MTDDKLMISHSQSTRSDKVKNRALILETAARLFAESGVEEVTMDAIAEAAGVGKGTLYRHFKNGKPDLCHALLDEDQRRLQERTLEQMRIFADPLANLQWFLNEALHFVDRNQALLCVNSASAGSLAHPAHWWWRQTIRGLLAQIRPSGDVDYMADTLYVMIDVHTIAFLRLVRGYDLERISAALLATLDKLAA
jgi:AcrR family transcriptional regulator